MRSKKVIEAKYNEYRLRYNALNTLLDAYIESGKPCVVNTDYECWSMEQESISKKMFALAWVLGYSKTP